MSAAKKKTIATTQRTCLLVLGMHRSGTSAFTRLANLMGAELSPNLLEAKEDNQQGFWEHKDIVDVHERLLAGMGSCWDDTRFSPKGWDEAEAIKDYENEIRAVLRRDFAESKLFAIKDPRLSLLLPLWLKILKKEKIRPVFVTVLRDPFSTAASLKKRNHFPVEKSLLLWCRYNLEAERGARKHPHVLLTMDEVMKDWQSVTKKVAKGLAVKWPHQTRTVAKDVEAFINPSLVHHARAVPVGVENAFIGAWAKRATKLLWQGALEGETDTKALDALYEDITVQMDSASGLMHFWVEEALRGRFYVGHVQKQQQDMHKLQGEIRELGAQLRIARKDLSRTIQRADGLQQALEAVVNSTSWKVTWPLRVTSSLARLALSPKTYKKMSMILRIYGAKELLNLALYALRVRSSGPSMQIQHGKQHYEEWVQLYDTFSEGDKRAMREHVEQMSHAPLISIVMPVYNVEEKWLREAIDSVRRQIYTNWELCIADDASPALHIKKVLKEYEKKDQRIRVVYRKENGHISESSNSALEIAKGEFVALMDHDDVIPEHALYFVAAEINKDPKVNLIYSDEDKMDEQGKRFYPYFKSDWNPDLFYCQNMISHLGVYRRSVLKKIGGFRKGMEGSQDYDLALRFLEAVDEQGVRHIPRILYHWRAIEGSTARHIDQKNYALEASRRAMQSYLDRRYKGQGVKLVESNLDQFHRTLWPLPKKTPKASLIIPTRNAVVLVKQCVESILERTKYDGEYEIIIVNNQSDDPNTLEYFKQIAKKANVRILDYPHPFNYSAINNFAVKHAKGEVMILLNNDTEVISSEWLREMVSHAIRSDVGAVGAKLYYPNDVIQHAGVILGGGAAIHPVATHMFHGLARDDAGYLGRAMMTQSLSAVTAACLAVTKKKYEEVDGLDETNLTVAFNDVDFCLKLREKGYRNIWTPYAELYHHESATRGAEDTPAKMERAAREVAFMRKRWKEWLGNDPYYNPNLDFMEADFSLATPPRTEKPWEQVKSKEKNVA